MHFSFFFFFFNFFIKEIKMVIFTYLQSALLSSGSVIPVYVFQVFSNHFLTVMNL